MSDFKIGDRVQIKPSRAEGYKHPWPPRVRKGLFGTITAENENWGFRVELEMPKRAKWPHDWVWGGVRPAEMIKVEEPAA